jgi:AcrR family transcriptional regulator
MTDASTRSNTKDQIIAAFDQLIYQQGFSHTSFAHIAKKVNISRGNFYYHFKNKSQILDAVIHLRMANTHSTLQLWEVSNQDPYKRIACYIDVLIAQQKDILRYGCPMANLSNELSRLNHPAQKNAAMLFTLYRTWLRRQFSALGFKQMADKHALYLLAQWQGVATLANAFSDPNLLAQESAKLHQWLLSHSG